MSAPFKFENGIRQGFYCPDCGSKNTYAIDSRQHAKGQRVRRKTCKDCGCRWNTIEIFHSYVGDWNANRGNGQED